MNVYLVSFQLQGGTDYINDFWRARCECKELWKKVVGDSFLGVGASKCSHCQNYLATRILRIDKTNNHRFLAPICDDDACLQTCLQRFNGEIGKNACILDCPIVSIKCEKHG